MFTAVVIPAVTEDLIRNTWKWFDDTLAKEPQLSAGSIVLIEIMQKSAFSSVKSRSDTGWPRASGRHILQLGCGALNGCSDEVHNLGVKLLGEAAKDILKGEYSVGTCLPRDFEEFHDPIEVSLQASVVRLSRSG
jgi:hypothetical protein